MKIVYLLGAVLLQPLGALAHDGEHVTSMWYQDPITMISLILALVASGAVLYGVLTKQKLFMIIPALVLTIAVVSGFSSYGQITNESEPMLAVTDFGAGQSVTLYKSPNCGCCSGHAEALEEAGFEVTIEETGNLDVVKQTHNIPADGASCHTTVIGDYVVEGHVPL